MKPNQKPTHTVYVVEGEGDKSHWLRIGSGWSHQDGQGMNIALSALPLNGGRLVIRVAKANEEAGR